MKKTILIVDDDNAITTSLQFLLEDEGFCVIAEASPEGALKTISRQPVDLVLMDMNYRNDTTSGTEGLALVAKIMESDPLIPIIVMTGWATIDIAVAALKSGARDFIKKPWNDDKLVSAINIQLRTANAEQEVERLSQQNQLLTHESHPQNRAGIVAKSQAMTSLLDTLDELANSNMNILLTGDNGTGKSMLAQYIHQQSSRNKKPFVAVNMGAIPENLFESELFGHVKGAFTDAKESRIGRFEIAQEGTLFLDELANIPLSQQGKLLRVLEEHQYEKVGSSKTQLADVRVVSATNANLQAQINEKQFRQDLYFRLNTVEVKVPSLKDRPEDIVPLAHYFLAKFSKKYNKPLPELSEAAIVQLQTYDWPGNIRELGHVIERSLFVCKHNIVEAAHLSIQYVSTESASFSESLAEQSGQIDSELTLEEIEIHVLNSRLKAHKGNATTTAKSLGLSRSGYYRRLSKYGLD